MDINSQSYKLTVWSSIRPLLWPLFVSIVLIAGFIPIISLAANSDSYNLALIVATILICITIVPPVVLEINYILHDRDTSVMIDHSNGILEIKSRNDLTKILIQDIIRIEKHHSGLERGDRVGRMHWYTYYYYKIYVSNQKSITVSRMILPRLEKKLENVKCELTWHSFPIIRS